MATRREDFSKHPLDQALEAIEAGNKDQALACARQVWECFRPLHDLYGDYVASLLTFISTTFGEPFVEQANRYVGEEVWKPLIMSLKEKGPAALAGVFASFLRAHGYDFTCDEDEEKFVFVSHFCPTGGRMKKEGKEDTSDRHAFNFGTTRNPYSWSFNQAGISYYCTHCALFMDTLPREWGWDVIRTVYGRQFDDLGNPVDEPCVITIFKNPGMQRDFGIDPNQDAVATTHSASP
ncbi:MAG TPA: hypothetical protein PLG17_04005 [Thermodesulfobacteriota bacterium]|nr:hypothetical protein [Thermodesulfobacteriota bacterium]